MVLMNSFYVTMFYLITFICYQHIPTFICYQHIPSCLDFRVDMVSN
jgi:hypothetical protein